MLALTSACVQTPKPPSAVGHYLSGRLAAQNMDVESAAANFASAGQNLVDPGAITEPAFIYHLAAGRHDAAARYAADLAGAGDTDVHRASLARLYLAASAIRSGDFDGALNQTSDFEFEEEFIPLRTIIETWAKTGLTSPGAALIYLDQRSEVEFSGFSPLHRAFLLERVGEYDEARGAYEQALVTLLGSRLKFSSFGAFLERHGEAGDAAEFYEVLSQNGGTTLRMREAARRREKAGVPSARYSAVTPSQGAAAGFYELGEYVFEITNQRFAAASRLGRRVQSRPNFDLPLSMAQTALMLDPELHDARILAAGILGTYQQYDAAIAMADPIPAASPLYVQAQLLIAAAYLAVERDDEAISVLNETLQVHPGEADLRWNLARLYLYQGSDDLGLAELTALINEVDVGGNDNAWRYHLTRGAVQMNDESDSAAEADLRRAVELAPDEPEALNALGYFWAERGENLEEAFDLIEKAIALQPKTPISFDGLGWARSDLGDFVDSLGWAHYQMGNFDDAIVHLERAATLRPDNAVITDHLGDAYWRLGREREARYQWRAALELDPSEDLADTLRQKLENGLEPTP
ncbi:MAG: tetratricopeptide repeat protein [Pseudomonadota bacterium]